MKKSFLFGTILCGSFPVNEFVNVCYTKSHVDIIVQGKMHEIILKRIKNEVKRIIFWSL